MDELKSVVAKAVKDALYYNSNGFGMDQMYHITDVSPLETQVKVWPNGRDQPPRYFTVKVSENQ